MTDHEQEHDHDHDHTGSHAEPQPPEAEANGDASPAFEGEFTEDLVRESLKAVIDPELGMNIVDLGLVYEVSVTDGDAYVQYTLTTMGCPIGPLIEAQMKEAAAALPGFKSLTPEIVFRPAWTPEMMSEEAKAAMGVF